MFSRKHRTIFFTVVLGLFLSSISISTEEANHTILKTDTSLPSSVVWSDDFENATETLSEWTIDADGTPDVTVNDGQIYSNGPDDTCIIHNSTTTVGSWSFDLFLGESDNYWIWVAFMSPHWEDYWFTPEGYAFIVDTSGGNHYLGLAYIYPDLAGAGADYVDQAQFDDVSGWLHLDITRQTDERMYVFLNGTLILDGRDTQFSTSEYFRVFSDRYFVVDNVTVSDSVDFDGVIPQWTESLVNHVVHEGDNFNHTLYASDYSGLDSWWVNDTANFVITQEGNIASIDPLPVGTYSVEVFVNDTFGNVLSGSFSVEVIEWPPPTPTTTTSTTITTPTTPTSTTGTNTTATNSPIILLLTGLVGGIGVSVIVLIILVRRKA